MSDDKLNSDEKLSTEEAQALIKAIEEVEREEADEAETERRSAGS